MMIMGTFLLDPLFI